MAPHRKLLRLYTAGDGMGGRTDETASGAATLVGGGAGWAGGGGGGGGCCGGRSRGGVGCGCNGRCREACVSAVVKPEDAAELETVGRGSAMENGGVGGVGDGLLAVELGVVRRGVGETRAGRLSSAVIGCHRLTVKGVEKAIYTN